MFFLIFGFIIICSWSRLCNCFGVILSARLVRLFICLLIRLFFGVVAFILVRILSISIFISLLLVKIFMWSLAFIRLLIAILFFGRLLSLFYFINALFLSSAHLYVSHMISSSMFFIGFMNVFYLDFIELWFILIVTIPLFLIISFDNIAEEN